LVRSHLIQQYNPIREYFENLETWDGIDYIKKSLNILKPMMMKHFIIILKNG
jgi:predicted P-loop ATPase